MASSDPADPIDRRALREAIPAHCLRPSTLRSCAHLGADLAGLAALQAASVAASGTAWLAPVVFLQGTLLWALFLVGHDCGHGAFSRRPGWNTAVGHLVHTPLLVPYHAWRLSHRAHHAHVGHVERDPAWPPLTRRQIRALPAPSRFMRLRAFLLVFPLYLLRNGPARHGSHFDPGGPLFPDAARHRVRRSVAACAAMAGGLAVFAATAGVGAFVQYWLAPWLVFTVWVSLVTYLQHTAPDVPWYRDGGWTPLRGALSTIDRHYGPFERIHHDVGHHVAHHLFPHIPHYRLREATAALDPLLGARRRRATEPVWRALWRAARRCQAVPEAGERVFYEPLAEPAARGARAEPSPWAAPPGGAGSSPANR